MSRVSEPDAPVENTGPHHFLVQAPVPPLDVDGFTVVVIGTIAFALTAIGFLIIRARLEAAGHGWWLGVAISGFALGLVGLAYCWDRRRKRRTSLLTLGE
jgi:hypothetical protein